MAFTVRLPFYSAGAEIAVTQVPGEGSHTGYTYTAWDFALSVDWRVRAIARGKVVDIRETVPDGDASQLTADASFGSGAIGNIVTIRHHRHGEVFFSSYFHLQEGSVPVAIGDHVLAGQEIGQVGLTGARTGAHLHLQVGTRKMLFGSSDPYGWPEGSDNHALQTVADASDIPGNRNLIQFAGYQDYGYALPDYVIGPPVATTTLAAAPARTGLHAGDETLSGGSDADLLRLGGGDDIATGGSGPDRFIFRAGADRITDFAPGEDWLILRAQAWGGAALTPAEALARFATEQDGTLIFDFSPGDHLVLHGLSLHDLQASDLLIRA
jgi:hypothetical protein